MTVTTSTPTVRQCRVLTAIRGHWAASGHGPTVRDLMDALGIQSPNGVVCHLTALARKGLIEWDRQTAARSIWPAGLRDAIRAAVAALPPVEG